MYSLDTFLIELLDNKYYYRQEGILKHDYDFMTGVSIKKLLQPIEYNNIEPLQLKKLIFNFVATNGKKVTFTYDEIFNSKLGNSLYVMTSKDEKSNKELSYRIMFIYNDKKKLRRKYLSGLQTIEIKYNE